jgi:methionyl-tRNA synthetase
MPETAKKFFLTTPIYYVNARPHIGHAYTTIAADVIARRHRLLGEDTFFLTGTDEHGQKVQRSAAAAGIPPQQFADEVSASFRNLWKRMGLLDDSLSKDDPLFHRDFIRTTEERHHRGVQHLWRQLEANGAIYLSSYTGQYCVSDEAFVDVPVGAPCPTCGRPTETITEENYFFRLSDFQQPLIDLIESGALHIQPETAKNEVLSFLRGPYTPVLDKFMARKVKEGKEFPGVYSSEDMRAGLAFGVQTGDLRVSAKGFHYVPGTLKDLSISRTTFAWGIQVPGNPKHVVYVWLDALANYMTAIGYGSDDPAEQAKFARFWPADLHLVGKEITRFHCLYWPAILLALNPKLKHGPNDPMPQLTPAEHAAWATKWLPKSIVANGWLLFEESKMSKSRGNVVRTETILDAFGEEVYAKQFPDSTKADRDLFAADVLRYFLLREIPFGQDGSFSFDALITRYNADLANGYGNLVSRTLSMIAKRDGTIPPNDKVAAYDPNFMANDVLPYHPMLAQANEASMDIEELSFSSALAKIGSLISRVDGYMNQYAPWKLVSSDDRVDQYKAEFILYSAADAIRIITALLYPIIPYATASVWRQLGLGDIEEAARNGKLKDLQWGGLQPGTKLGPLAPIFPRADKGLAQIMTDMESSSIPASQTTPAPENAAPTPEKSVPSVASVLSSPPGETSTISIDDFAKVDLRVAQIVVAERIPKADKLLRLEVDLGPNFPRRQILAGIAEYYQPEALIGRKVVIVANLAPRKMRGLESQGMVVAASIGPAGAPVLAGFLEDVELGARLK